MKNLKEYWECVSKYSRINNKVMHLLMKENGTNWMEKQLSLGKPIEKIFFDYMYEKRIDIEVYIKNSDNKGKLKAL